jgi:hypothetical protein
VVVLNTVDGGTISVDGGVAIVSGPAGPLPLKGYAEVSFSGVLVLGKNVTAAMVSPATGNAGVLCFRNLPFTFEVMLATPIATYGLASANQVLVAANANAFATGCTGGSDGGFSNAGFVTGYRLAAPGTPGPADFDIVGVSFF